MRFAFRSIRTKLLIAFTALALIPLITYGVLATREATSQLEMRAGLALAQAANDTGLRIAAYLHERLGDVNVFSSNQIAINGSPADLGVLTDAYVRAFPEYDLIVVTDAAGQVIATNSSTGDNKPVDRTTFVGKSMRGQTWYEQIATGQVPPGGAYLSSSEIDPLIAEVSHGPGHGFTVSAGIYDASGKLLRVWSNHVSWARSVGAIMDAELEELRSSGHSIEISMIDRSGTVIDSEKREDVFKYNLVTQGADFAKRVVAGERSYVKVADPIDHIVDVIGFAPVPDHGAFKANGWALYAHQPVSEIAAATAGLRNFGIVMVVAAIAFVLIVGFLVARTFSRPLVASAATLQRVANGDLTARATVHGRDEVAQMNGALNNALDRLRLAFSAIGESAVALSRSSDGLAKIGHALDGSASDTSRQAGVVAAASEQAGKNVQTVASGTEEMGVTIKEIAKNAASAARVATSAVSSAQRTNELVVKLGDSSSEIGNVLKVITTIAEQTNLLALNATIEAARAGEAGKGFAVVANEVKELAKETAKATEEITRKISAIQSDATSAITAITEITQVIGEINDIQNTIASSVEEQAATTNEISRNIHELAQSSGEIAQNVTSVAAAAGATANCSTQTRAAASELADLSRRLDAQMSQFTYADSSSMTAREMPRTHTTSGTLVRIPTPANVIPRSRNTSTGYSH